MMVALGRGRVRAHERMGDNAFSFRLRSARHSFTLFHFIFIVHEITNTDFKTDLVNLSMNLQC